MNLKSYLKSALTISAANTTKNLLKVKKKEIWFVCRY